MGLGLVAGWSCAVCGKHVDIAEPLVWRCPNASDHDRHHALQIVQSIAPLRGSDDANPFVAFQRYLAWDSFAAANGMTEAARAAMTANTDAAIATVEGISLHTTPFARADELSEALGFTGDGGVWVKDETGQVAGSHKPRHLVTILLHVLSAESMGLATWRGIADRPPLAIASCGNAAFAAGVLAKAADWPLRVFVPPHADPVVLSGLRDLQAEIIECPRRDSDQPGDPCMHRFREAVAEGAIPFTVQGTENAWCLDGGRTIGWEMARQFEETEIGPPLDRVFAQVGAGTFAACLAAGVQMGGVMPKLHAVQTDSCAPLERAWNKAAQAGGPSAASSHWSELMWPWEHVGKSAADGILDDETYDWIPVMRAMDGGGSPIVVSESLVEEANELARKTTGVNASHTGTAGLAGLMAVMGVIDPSERVAVVFSGVSRSSS